METITQLVAVTAAIRKFVEDTPWKWDDAIPVVQDIQMRFPPGTVP